MGPVCGLNAAMIAERGQLGYARGTARGASARGQGGGDSTDEQVKTSFEGAFGVLRGDDTRAAKGGQAHVTQSHSEIVDPTLTYRDLSSQGSILKPPSGWSYSWKRLTSTLELNSNGLAYVVNDNLGDSYQQTS